jgi:hypothetical protein
LGIRVEGRESQSLLAETVQAYREALKVYTREHLPQDWAATQNDLGNALWSQGERAEGAEGVQGRAEPGDMLRSLHASQHIAPRVRPPK